MKTKLVLWGSNAQEERVLIAMELRPEDNKVDLYTFSDVIATDEFAQTMLRDWRNGAAIEFPEGHTHVENELSVSESLLPENLKVERTDIVNRAQTEWHFIVLSAKLNDVYQRELGELKAKVEQLSRYDSEVWNELKTFWSKVQGQVRDRNLFREHADSLRDNTNALFSRLKELRSKLDDEFQTMSKSNVDKFFTRLDDVENRIKEGLRLQSVFEDLKQMQRRFRETKFTREDRSSVWKRLDGAFKTVKEKRFGPGANREASPSERLHRRYDGLVSAIEKMQRSIGRDHDDLAFQKRKIATTDGQLEAQIRQAKIKMIEERVRSKEEKMAEMARTKNDLEKRIQNQKEKEAKRAEKEKIEAARAAAAEKIKEEMAAKAAAADTKKLEKAAEAIQAVTPKVKKKNEDSMLEAVATTLGESFEDAVDTVRAVAEVVGEKIGEAVEDLKEQAENTANKASAAAQNLKDEGTKAVGNVKKSIDEATSSVSEQATTAAKTVKTEASNTVNKVKESVSEASSSVSQKASEAVSNVKAEANATVDSLKEGTTKVANTVKTEANQVADAAKYEAKKVADTNVQPPEASSEEE